MRDGFYSGAIRSPLTWKPPVGSAAHEYKCGRVLPMEAPRKSLFKALRDAWRGW